MSEHVGGSGLAEGRPEPRLLTVIGSAGYGPWLDIEKAAQEPILRQLGDRLGEALWFEADPRLGDCLRYRILAKVFGTQIDLAYECPRVLRRFWDLWLRRFQWHAFGTQISRIFISGVDQKTSKVGSHRIRVHLPPQMPLAVFRSVAMFEYALENFSFDYLLRLTSTCLPVPDALAHHLRTLPEERGFAGHIGDFQGESFVSGAALLMSRDVVENVVLNWRKLRLNVPEDVAISRLVYSQDFAEFRDIARYDAVDQESARAYRNDLDSRPVVVRCKAQLPETVDAEPVIGIMRAVAPML